MDEITFAGKHLHFCRAANGWEYVHRPRASQGVTIDIIGNNDVPLHAVVKSSRETTSCGSDYNLAYSR